MASTTTNGASSLPEATLVVASVTGFLSSGTVNVTTTSNGVQQVNYSGTQTSPSVAFTGCSGGSGAFASGASVTQSQDQGITLAFIPVESLVSPASGLLGNPPSGVGQAVYTAISAAFPNDFTPGYDFGGTLALLPAELLVSPASGLVGNPPAGVGQAVYTAILASYPNDFTPGGDRGVSFNTALAPIPVTTSSTPTTYYLMRAYESGGSCSGTFIRTWVVVNAPDLTGAYYTGARCYPTPGTLSNFQVLAVW